MKRKCNGIAVGCIPSSLCTVIKGLAISLWTYPIIWVNHIISMSLCNVFKVFCILFNDLTVYLLLLYGHVFQNISVMMFSLCISGTRVHKVRMGDREIG